MKKILLFLVLILLCCSCMTTINTIEYHGYYIVIQQDNNRTYYITVVKNPSDIDPVISSVWYSENEFLANPNKILDDTRTKIDNYISFHCN